MKADTRLGLALGVALCLQLLPWSQLTRHAGALQLCALAVVVVLAVGWAARRLRLSGTGVGLAELGGLGVVAVAGIWVVHGPAQVVRLPVLFGEGLAFIRGSTAPMFPNPGATLVLVVSVGLLALAADWAALGWQRPAWAAAPLVVLHLVMAIGLTTATLFSEFVLLALGIALVLLAASPWGADRPGTRAAAWATVGAMAVGAIGLSWAVALAVPTFEARRTNDPLQMTDPSLDLKRNLVQGSTEVVIRYTTDSPGGTYLKLATLPALSVGGFALSDVRVATGRMPSPPGSPAGQPRTTSVEIGAFRSEWLPVPYAPTGFDAPGDWGFALDTLDVMALAGPSRGTATEGISYVVQSLDVRPSGEAVAGAAATGGGNRALTTSLPPELPGRIRDLAIQVTRDAPTAGAKAQALEAYLRSDRFTYSTAPSAGNGDGLATIDDFLFRSRRGYCEQFAGAMAIMARELGIPARMAVGFVPGQQNGDTWEVTARDLHTWPELWLDNLGWVAFEPTPSRGSANGEAPGPAPTGTAGPEAEPSLEATPTAEPSPEPSAAPEPGAAGPGADAVLGALPWVVLVVVLLVAGGAALAVPRLLRGRRRTQRLAGTGDAQADTLAAWEEIREVASDLRIGWPEGSPRFAAERLVGRLGDDPAAADALRRLAAASERALFDRRENYDLQGVWTAEVAGVTAALTRQAREDAHRRGRANARPRRAAR